MTAPLVQPLDALPRDALALAGGKALNLGELLRGGLPVPLGFCVTTGAYTQAVAGANLDALLDELAAIAPQEHAQQERLATAIRGRILAAPVPEDVAAAVGRALETLGADTPVAVRSSATAEDLPFASFAGQQDTYLNVAGAEAVLDAVRRCWASLWTDRAVAYRATNGIDPRAVRLAVVVQRLVDAAVAGVLFTANPLTGRRGEPVVDASPGLGEAVVSGAVNPDHFVIDVRTGVIRERRLGDRRISVRRAPEGGTHRVVAAPEATGRREACLSDAQLRDLAALGRRVERLFGVPQDIEFAVDAAGTLWLTQARPITTLFPLPAGAPEDPRDLRVYFNFNVAQGVFRPFTPMGLQAFRLLSTSFATLWGAPPRDPEAGAPVLTSAAGRIFLDVTALLRSNLGRRLALGALSKMETRSVAPVRALFDDPRLAPRRGSGAALVMPVVRILIRTRVPLRAVQALAAPAAARVRAWRLRDEILAGAAHPDSLPVTERLALAERLLLTWPERLFPAVLPLLLVGLGCFAAAWRLLGDLVTAEEKDRITRALPHNPTTEMDLALWALARRVRADAAAATALRTRAPAELGEAYRAGTLPPALQDRLRAFLAVYGHRGVAEIDMGLPRWSEAPDHLLGVLANYLSVDDASGGNAQFQAAAAQADATLRQVARRAGRRGRWRRYMVGFLLRRGRALAGARELPKFLIVLLLAQARAVLAPIGPELVAAGRLDQADDLWLLSIPEVRAALAGQDQRPLVDERRARYAEELRRHHLPRVLLSDGTEPAMAGAGGADGETAAGVGAADEAADGAGGVTLRGTPASAGHATAPARVILDPVGAVLVPGEILVAPSTDPGWTPLFLTAGGLVMEMGGAMSHGAVVAREYGIPAVVGVPGATNRIRTGQRLTVDGGAGTVHIASAGNTAGAETAKEAR